MTQTLRPASPNFSGGEHGSKFGGDFPRHSSLSRGRLERNKLEQRKNLVAYISVPHLRENGATLSPLKNKPGKCVEALISQRCIGQFG